MLFSDQQQDIPMAESPMPSIDLDLMAAEADGYFTGLPAFRTMATLELLRHGEISLAQAAGLIGVSIARLTALLQTLPISDLQQLVHDANTR